MPLHLPSLDVPVSEKSKFSEADVHSSLFEKDAKALGYPARDSTQADGAYFMEQGALALRRLASKKSTGRYDGLYLVGNSPVVLVEIKRYGALDSPKDRDKAHKQIIGYALSKDFATPPPFLFLYCGKPEHSKFWRLKEIEGGALLSAETYEEQPEPWSWARIMAAHTKGEFAQEVVGRDRLLKILLDHLDKIADDIRPDIKHAVEIVGKDEPPAQLTDFGKWLVAHPEALRELRCLYQRKLAEIGATSSDAGRKKVAEEMTVQASLNYLNKVFFLNLMEERNLPGFFRILREFLPESRTEISPATAAVFLGLLKRKIKDTSNTWDPEDEAAYRELRADLVPDIGHHVIEQNNWWSLIRVAFDLAEERFPLVYHSDAYDVFRPHKERLAELVFDLSTKSFSSLDNHAIGDVYQGLMGTERKEQSRLGAFYTPQSFVEYMVKQLGLTQTSKVLDPCMGSGHFLEGLVDELVRLHGEHGFTADQAYGTVVSNQVYGADIDSFAASLSAIRMFLAQPGQEPIQPNLWVHDMLLHTPDRPGTDLFNADIFSVEGDLSQAKLATAVMDPALDQVELVDEIAFDAVVGNPPYGARKPAYKEKVYGDLYGNSATELSRGSIGTGDHDTYSMFFVSAVGRLREGGRLTFVTSDSFRTLYTHRQLRKWILDNCKIVEVLLTDTKHFEGVSFQYAGMAITTLERCSDAEARSNNVMRLVDTVSDPKDFEAPPAHKIFSLRQAEFETLPDTPFAVGVPDDIVVSILASGRLADVAFGAQGLATADDKYFLAGIDHAFPGLPNVIDRADLVDSELTDDEKKNGVLAGHKHWVPFEKGEGFGEYWRPPSVAINWSESSVSVLAERDKWKAGTPKRPRFQNRDHYFKPGLTYSVVSSGRLSFRLMPKGAVFGHKGSAVFPKEGRGIDTLFLLGFLNSALATFLMKRIVNSTATADVGYIGRLPFRKPDSDTHDEVVRIVGEIVEALRDDPEADIGAKRSEIDDLIFGLFEIDQSKKTVLDFYDRVGLVEQPSSPAE